MIIRAPQRPWRPDDTRHACRGRVLVRTRAELPHVPHGGDVALGATLPALGLDHDRIDRVVSRRSPAMRVTRPFHAARNVTTIGSRHLGWDDDELRLGLARTVRIDVAPDTPIHDLVAALAELDAVEVASPVYLTDCPFAAPPPTTPVDPATIDDWGHAWVGSAAALALEAGDPAIIIAVIDSGVVLDHPELRGRCRAGADLVDLPQADVSRDVRLLGDHAHRDRWPVDQLGHGTACASLLAARGLAMAAGVAGDAQVLPMRALAAAQLAGRPRPTAIGTLPDIDVAVKLAVDLGARVLNLSFGTPESALGPDDPVPHAEVVEYALARGCVLVAASGNSGDDVRYLPAALPGVIAVGAIDRAGRPAPFSTRGPHVAVSAPGVDVRAAALTGLAVYNGTSFAAPFVAGAAALLLAAATRRLQPLSPHAIRDLLVRTARPWASGVDGRGGGAGTLDLAAALAVVRQLKQDFDDEDGDLSGDPRGSTASHLGRGADRPQLI